MGEDWSADGIDHARHLFCCIQVPGLSWVEIVAECTRSLSDADVKLLECASTARWMGVAFA
jgi:hypothetical protein